jgi:hypothetical protein
MKKIKITNENKEYFNINESLYELFLEFLIHYSDLCYIRRLLFCFCLHGSYDRYYSDVKIHLISILSNIDNIGFCPNTLKLRYKTICCML